MQIQKDGEEFGRQAPRKIINRITMCNFQRTYRIIPTKMCKSVICKCGWICSLVKSRVEQEAKNSNQNIDALTEYWEICSLGTVKQQIC